VFAFILAWHDDVGLRHNPATESRSICADTVGVVWGRSPGPRHGSVPEDQEWGVVRQAFWCEWRQSRLFPNLDWERERFSGLICGGWPSSSLPADCDGVVATGILERQSQAPVFVLPVSTEQPAAQYCL